MRPGAVPGAPPAPPHATFYLSFRPAAIDPLDDNTLPVGIPSDVPMADDTSASALYFARLHTVPNPPTNTRVTNFSSRKSSPGRSRADNAGGGDTAGGSSSNSLVAMAPAVAAAALFDGLRASHILGQGAFGTVWHARWHGAPVAMKVRGVFVSVCMRPVVWPAG